MPLNDNGVNNRNLIVVVMLFMAMMFCYSYFTGNNDPEPQKADEVEHFSNSSNGTSPAKTRQPEISIEEAITSRRRVMIENENIMGSIDPNGCILDIVTLKGYRQTTEKDSEYVRLLTPKGTRTEFYYGITYNDKTNNERLDEDAVWIPDEQRKDTVVLNIQTKHGVTVKRTVAIDDKYLINVTDEVTNASDKAISISANAYMVRSNPTPSNYAVVHEGLIGNSSGKITELKYGDVGGKTRLSESDWFGFTDIHWLCALINKDPNFKISYLKTGDDSFKISAASCNDIELQPNTTTKICYSAFTGPKDIGILSKYGKQLGLHKFDMAIDFGWFFIVTKPLIHIMDILAKVFSNMGLVILILTLMFKILTYPLTRKSFTSMAKMKALQPRIAVLQKTYSNDKMRLNQELIALYKKENVSPMSGCLPMLLQAPIFFCLYKVFFVSIQMRHAPLFLWISDLSVPDPLYVFNLFGLIDWTPPGFLCIGVWPIIMGLTMFLQQRLSSAKSASPAEKTNEQKMQENMMIVLPIMFTYICSSFPVGVVIYWTISNIISMVQQRYTMGRYATLS
ncbi:MAG: membrane protein insertase YidC [Holosporales bacterium]|jgi:YidC/Oxa1 family membrane protein insertase|nr:membrane protein insertase YidC [Holosporales bacterium]